MRLTADIVFEPDVVAQRVHETGLPVARVVIRVVHGDNDLKLRRADPAYALGRNQRDRANCDERCQSRCRR